MRIRGRRGMLKPLDWDLAARWEKAGFPLHVVIRTMSDIAAKFYRENGGRDQINSLRYFDNAVRKNCADFQARQVGKFEVADGSETPLSELLEVDVEKTLETLEKEVNDFNLRQPKVNPEILAIALEIRELRTLKSIDERSIESRLQELDRRLVSVLRSTVSEQEKKAFESAGTSADPYLRQAQISSAIRKEFEAPEISLFLDC